MEPILTKDRQVPAVDVVGAERFLLFHTGHCYWPQILGKDSPTRAASNSLFALPHLLHQKDSPAPAALAAGAGHYFLPLSIYPLSSLLRKWSTQATSFRPNPFHANYFLNVYNLSSMPLNKILFKPSSLFMVRRRK